MFIVLVANDLDFDLNFILSKRRRKKKIEDTLQFIQDSTLFKINFGFKIFVYIDWL